MTVMNCRGTPWRAGAIAAAALVMLSLGGPVVAGPTPVLTGHTDRALRYLPVDHGFEITNGSDSFNRPLYGGNTAFRIDAGDRPEFSFYLPGRGGVLRVGLAGGEQALWLRDAGKIVARYADGAYTYTVTDPAFPGVTVKLTVAAARQAEALALRAETTGATEPLQLLLAYGGLNGEKAKRDGDIGTEAVSVAQYFALKPDHCKGNVIDIGKTSFSLRGKGGAMASLSSDGAAIAMADAKQWDNAAALRDTAGQPTDRPVALTTIKLAQEKPVFFSLQRKAAVDASEENSTQPSATQPSAATPDQAEAMFTTAIAENAACARQVVVDTPDPFVDSAVAAMCMAADAIWDDATDSVVHGGVAWRRPLLGWRGPYSPDAIGRHDRAEAHLMAYFKKQNTRPTTQPVAPDASENLARSERALRTDGDLTDAHYDMNLVAIDMFFRHLLWTGDLDLARREWPVVVRHLAWERRLLRRPFGSDGLPLYEAYACIWASDDLQYSGGGVTHASAYNFYHNMMAARVAAMLGEDPKPYADEAALIRRAMQQHLWLPDQGWFAEYKDLLGRQSVHPDAALWTHYHTIDSEVPDAFEAWEMCRYIDTRAVHIPIRGQGVPTGLFTLSTSDWMPYTWSINNVAMAEVTHTALADWQAGRADVAFAAWKGAVVDSMFLGQCPGNLHMTSFFDAYRQEAQRDSGDPIGATWRAVIEGLFGIRPDALAGELLIDPGFPADWDRAAIRHADLSMKYRRAGNDDTFSIEPKFNKPMRLKLRVAVRNEHVVKATVNGKPAAWRSMDERIGDPHIEITAPASEKWDVVVTCDGDALRTVPIAPGVAAIGEPIEIGTAARELLAVKDPQGVLNASSIAGRKARGIAAGTPGARSLFMQVRQGDLTWWQAAGVELRPALEVTEAAVDLKSRKLGFRLTNNSKQDLDAKATIELNGVTKSVRVQCQGFNTSGRIVVDAPALLPGRNRFTVTLPGRATIVAEVTDWKQPAAAGACEAVDLAPYFNDRVTQVFKNRYVSPRSPYCSLAIPVQGFGGWATNKTTPSVDDTGLRGAGGTVALASGVSFTTPSSSDAKNVLFTSQWDNYPHEASIPLSGRSDAAYLLMAGTTNAMQSRFDNGEVIVTYADGGSERLVLRNPETWWPIEQDYFMDDYAFRLGASVPPRVDLKSGRVRMPGDSAPPAKIGGGGSATVFSLPLDPKRELKSLTVRTLANEVVIGLMGVTLHRPTEANPATRSTTRPAN